MKNGDSSKDAPLRAQEIETVVGILNVRLQKMPDPYRNLHFLPQWWSYHSASVNSKNATVLRIFAFFAAGVGLSTQLAVRRRKIANNSKDAPLRAPENETVVRILNVRLRKMQQS